MTVATILPPNHFYLNNSSTFAPLLFLLLHSIKELMRDDGRVMSFHEDLFSGIIRFYLNTSNHIGFA